MFTMYIRRAKPCRLTAPSTIPGKRTMQIENGNMRKYGKFGVRGSELEVIIPQSAKITLSHIPSPLRGRGAGVRGSIDRTPQSQSSKPSCNIIVRLLVVRVCEYLLGGPEFDELSHVQKTRHIRYARRLLHVVGHDDDRDVCLQ